MRWVLLLAVLLASCSSTPAPPGATGEDVEGITLPDGYRITWFARGIPGARSLAEGTHGTIFVGSRGAGNVYAVVDSNRDGVSDRMFTLAQGLNSPNGVAFRDGALYVAEINRILRYDAIESHLDDPPTPVVVIDTLPRDGHHGWKFIRFGPDDKLYVPVGAPCNVCERDDNPQYASILRMNPDGTDLEVFASGVRNTVGFDWHPQSQELWFTDNGRDLLGDNLPADELNRAPTLGLHFGFPYCHQGDFLDPEFGVGRSCSEFTAPVQKLGPHVAALGMRFYTGTRFPQADRGAIFIAEHGSWNSSVPVGYRVTRVRLDGNTAVSYEPFATGWLQNGSAWGRPVDVHVLGDGSLLVSDDQAGAIYRIDRR